MAASVSLGEVVVDDGDVYWSELRPTEAGRVQLVRRSAGSDRNVDLLPEGFSARTRVHEYGGGAWSVAAGVAYFTNWTDQRLYRFAPGDDGPRPLSPAPTEDVADRHADIVVSDGRVICVRERHRPGSEAVNEIVSLPAGEVNGDVDGGPGDDRPVTVLVTGPDFVSNPRVSPDGTRLAWVEWDHPAMPWDATRLCVGTLVDGATSLVDRTVVAGGDAARPESAIMPAWSPDGVLHFVSDRSDWWNIERVDDLDGTPTRTAVTAGEFEIGTPPWVFGMSRYGFLPDGRIMCSAASAGADALYLHDGTPGTAATPVEVPDTEIASLAVRRDGVVYVGAAFDREAAVVAVDLDPATSDAVRTELREPRRLDIDRRWFPIAEAISFEAGDGRTSYANYFPPTNPDHEAPPGTAPPLLVLIHGGPTAMARARLDLAKVFWTSRGFAVVDVNYGGSVGFGRPYRELLQDAWGILDVEDCVAAARHLADAGLADAERLCIRGGSAGGFTVLAALSAAGDLAGTFAAGASSYGVADLTALAEETHKFESRYLDGLVGPYPEARDVYEERSPINHVDRLDSPLIVFQGLEDEIVPPNQSEMIVAALRAKGVPVAYLAFDGEQHGFRKSSTVITVLSSELAFYGRVLGFTPAGDLPAADLSSMEAAS